MRLDALGGNCLSVNFPPSILMSYNILLNCSSRDSFTSYGSMKSGSSGIIADCIFDSPNLLLASNGLALYGLLFTTAVCGSANEVVFASFLSFLAGVRFTLLMSVFPNSFCWSIKLCSKSAILIFYCAT